jgi:hypothetical protein
VADLLRAPGARRRGTGAGFAEWGQRFKHERYEELRRAQPGREEAVAGHIASIDAWMVERGLTIERMTRDDVKAMSLDFAAGKPAPEPASLPPGIDGTRLVTFDEAVALPGTPSRSTLRRRVQDGSLRQHQLDGRIRYRVADLYSSAVGGGAALRRGPKPRGALPRKVLQDRLWVFKKVTEFAGFYGVPLQPGWDSVELPKKYGPEPREAQVLSLSECGQLATHLHVVHQLVLWLLRVLGLRISEAFGVLVGDVIDLGPGEAGVVAIHQQGGRTFKVRSRTTGEVHTSPTKDSLKNEGAYRVLAIPPALMELIRRIVAIFHTTSDGRVDYNARLIPALRIPNEGGQSSFRKALREAATAVGLAVPDGGEESAVVPHDLRHSVISDLGRKKLPREWRKRFAGHIVSDDVHAHYQHDDPQLRPVRKIAKKLQKLVDKELPTGLMVPTDVRCTTGHQRALAADAARIDAALEEVGWQQPLGQDDPLLDAAAVAAELGVQVQTARRYLSDGTLAAAAAVNRHRGQQRYARLSDVHRLRDALDGRVTIAALADELGEGHATVYQHLRTRGVEPLAFGREHTVSAEVAEQVGRHYRRKAALLQRAVPLSVAASELGTRLAQIKRLIADGVLAEDDRLPTGARTVTRDSVAAEKARRSPATRRTRRAAGRPDLLDWERAKRVSGLSESELRACQGAGDVTVVQHNRRRHVTVTSLMRYLAEHRPERLLPLAE